MKSIYFAICVLTICFCSCKNDAHHNKNTAVVAGQMPGLVTDLSQKVHLVYGNGDSILHAVSSDHGATFSAAGLVAIVPKLAASHMRGPQIATTPMGLSVIACNNYGDIFSFAIDPSGKWAQSARVNDKDTVAKENLLSLGSNGTYVYAVWLDLRDKYNKIFGARSDDGGRTWSQNIMIYTSPDSTVCECCKPSVAVKGDQVHVMFRNWIDGNRDMYLISSSDKGTTFSAAQKLGQGSWALDGCPMDGGKIAINEQGNAATVWRRKDAVYSCEPGKEEKKIGEGRDCTMETVNGKNIYAWVEDGNVVMLKPDGKKEILGEGQQPVVGAIDNEQVICAWEKDKKIYKAVVKL